jgi:lysophospholipase L1-like esterase
MRLKSKPFYKLKWLLFFSLATNFILLCVSASYIYQKGGISFLFDVTPKSIDSPVYLSTTGIYAKTPRKDAALIFVGDSLTSLCPWSELLEHPVLNRAVSGDTLEGLARHIDEVLQHHPAQLFIMIGTNELSSGKTSAQVLSEYRSLVKHIRKSSPSTEVFLQSILPVNVVSNRVDLSEVRKYILQVNKGLADMVDGKEVTYVDLYSKMVVNQNHLMKQYTVDGVHLSAAGYLRWKDIIHPYLKTQNNP